MEQYARQLPPPHHLNGTRRRRLGPLQQRKKSRTATAPDCIPVGVPVLHGTSRSTFHRPPARALPCRRETGDLNAWNAAYRAVFGVACVSQRQMGCCLFRLLYICVVHVELGCYGQTQRAGTSGFPTSILPLNTLSLSLTASNSDLVLGFPRVKYSFARLVPLICSLIVATPCG